MLGLQLARRSCAAAILKGLQHGVATSCLPHYVSTLPDRQITREELVLSLRQQSKGFQRSSSQFRGVTRHQKGKWEARIGQVQRALAWHTWLVMQEALQSLLQACTRTRSCAWPQ